MPFKAMAKAALEEELPHLMQTAKRLGWTVDVDEEEGFYFVGIHRPNLSDAANTDRYLVRVGFDLYPVGQPSLVFVSPDDRRVGDAEDFLGWWPNIDGNPWINVQVNAADPGKSYLCFQLTQEFRETHAEPGEDDPTRYVHGRHNFVGALIAVDRALKSAFYQGPRK